jgi:hypothetical protein
MTPESRCRFVLSGALRHNPTLIVRVEAFAFAFVEHGACFLRFSDVRFQRIPTLSDQYGKQLLVHGRGKSVSPIGLSRDWIIAKAPYGPDIESD